MCKILLLFLFNAKKKRRFSFDCRPGGASGGAAAYMVYRPAPSPFVPSRKESTVLPAPNRPLRQKCGIRIANRPAFVV